MTDEQPSRPGPPEVVAGVRLPGRHTNCRLCGAQIVFARTLATERKPGGKAMPLDPTTNPAGNVAVRDRGHGRLVCRVLTKGEDHDHFTELRAMPHHATCQGLAANIGKVAEEFLATTTGGEQP